MSQMVFIGVYHLIQGAILTGAVRSANFGWRKGYQKLWNSGGIKNYPLPRGFSVKAQNILLRLAFG